MNVRSFFLLFLVATAFSHRIAAAPGDLDTTFGEGGMVTTEVGRGRWSCARTVALQDDGKIVVAGSADDRIAVVRLIADGSRDETFGYKGEVSTDLGGRNQSWVSVALQRDGKIVVAGSLVRGVFGLDSNYALLRYNADGSLDHSFNDTGKVIIPITQAEGSCAPQPGVAVQVDGRILVTGISQNGTRNEIALFRYNADGRVDINFNGTGKVTTALDASDSYSHAITLQPDGKILVAGTSFMSGFALVRYTTDGSLDTTLNGTGIVTALARGRCAGLALQPDGKIVAVGTFLDRRDHFAAVRYNADGSLDASFGGAGKLITTVGRAFDRAHGVAIQSDGKIVVSGESWTTDDYELAVVRYNPDGSLDKGFHGTGVVQCGILGTKGFGCAIQRDGRIVVAGCYSNAGHALEKFAVFRFEN